MKKKRVLELRLVVSYLGILVLPLSILISLLNGLTSFASITSSSNNNPLLHVHDRSLRVAQDSAYQDSVPTVSVQQKSKYTGDFFGAVHKKIVKDVERLLQKCLVDKDTVNEQGNTALHLVVKLGCEEIVNLLIEKDANINAKDKDQKTPLQLAAENDHKAIIGMLLEAGADKDGSSQQDKGDQQPRGSQSSFNSQQSTQVTLDYVKPMSSSIGVTGDSTNSLFDYDDPISFSDGSNVPSFLPSLLTKDFSIKYTSSNSFIRSSRHCKEQLYDSSYNFDDLSLYRADPDCLSSSPDAFLLDSPRLLPEISSTKHASSSPSQSISAIGLSSFSGNQQPVSNSLSSTPQEFQSPMIFQMDQSLLPVEKGRKKRKPASTNKSAQKRHKSMTKNDNQKEKAAIEAIEAFIAENPLQENLSKKLLEVSKKGNNPKVIEMLIKAGADIHASNKYGNTPLHLAVDNGQTATVEMLLKNGVDIEAVNNLDRTPLHTAANDEYPSIVTQLLGAGAKIEAVDNKGMTPLHLAAVQAKKNNTRTCKRNVELLLAAGAHKDAVDKNGKTPLDLAQEKGNKAIVEMLGKAGEKRVNLDENGLHEITVRKTAQKQEAIQNGTKQKRKKSEYSKVDVGKKAVNKGDQGGTDQVILDLLTGRGTQVLTPLLQQQLFEEIQKGDLYKIKELLRAGVNVCGTNTNSSGSTPLHFAVLFNRLSIAKYLVEEGASVNAHNKRDGNTPLHDAVDQESEDMVKLLLSYNADVTLKNDESNTPLDEARKQSKTAIIELLLQAGERQSNEEDIESNFDLYPVMSSLQKDEGDLKPRQFVETSSIFLPQDNNFPPIMPLSEDVFVTSSLPSLYGHETDVMVVSKGIEGSTESSFQMEDVSSSPSQSSSSQTLLQEPFIIIPQETNQKVGEKRKYPPIHKTSQKDHRVKAKIQNNAHKENIEIFLAKGPLKNDLSIKLLSVSRKGDIEAIEMLIKAGADINASNRYGNTPLHLAVQYRYRAMVELLLKAGAKTDVINKDNETPLHKAVLEGNEEIIEQLLTIGAKTDVIDKDGNTPLHTAAQNDNEVIVEMLLKAGAKTDVVNKDNETPLHKAVLEGNEEIIEQLLTIGAKTDVIDKDGNTPLHTAAQQGYGIVADLLLKARANVDVVNNDHKRPLDLVAYYGHREIVAMLLATGANKDFINKNNGNALLHYAAGGGMTNLVKTLLDAGANKSVHEGVVALLIEKDAKVGATDKNNSTPLHEAAQNGHVAVIKILLKAGADKEAVDKDRLAPLHYAAYNGREKAVVLFIEKRAKVSAVDKNGETPLHWTAKHDEQTAAVKAFIKVCTQDKAFCDQDELYYNSTFHQLLQPMSSLLVDEGHKAVVEMLLKAGVNKEARDNNQSTPLHRAAQEGNEVVVEMLVKAGADKEAQDKDGMTPLHWAAWNGHDTVVEILIVSFNKETQDKDGNTPLHYAAQNGHGAVVNMLLRAGATKDAIDKNSKTPLHIAVEVNNMKIVQLLLENGVNVGLRDIDNKTPFDLAEERGYKGISELLRQFISSSNSSSLGSPLFDCPNLSPIFSSIESSNDVALSPSPLFSDVGLGFHETSQNDNNLLPINNSLFVPRESYQIIYPSSNSSVSSLSSGRSLFELNPRPAQPPTMVAQTSNPSGSLTSASIFDELSSLPSFEEPPSFTIFDEQSLGNFLNCDSPLSSTPLDQSLLPVEKGRKKRKLASTNKSAQKRHKSMTKNDNQKEKAAIEAIEAFIAENPLQENLSKKLLEVSKKGNNPKVIEMLIKAGADIHASNKYGNTPLHLAVDHGQTATVEMLLKNGADIEAVNNLDRTPLHTAANDEYPSIVTQLLGAGAKIEAVDNKGMTPLHLAAVQAKKNNTRTCKRNVELLLAAGAHKDAVDKNGKTPLDLAQEKGNEAIVEMLLKLPTKVSIGKDVSIKALRNRKSNKTHPKASQESNGEVLDAQDKDGWTQLHWAAYNGDEAIVDKLIIGKASKNAVNLKGETPLHLAAAMGQIAIVDKLIRANVNKDAVTKNHWTPLYLAAARGHGAVVEILLTAGANKEVIDKDGWTPLHWAAYNGDEAIVDKLIIGKAPKNAVNLKSQTPLHLAAAVGHAAVVNKLIRAGANKDATDAYDWTPFHWAVRNGHRGVIEILLRNQNIQDIAKALLVESKK